MLIVIIFVMVGMMIAALAMAPAITTQIKRDREQEFIHRGAQYARAIKKYHKKFGRYPPTLEALEDTNHMRFLRKRYKDPLVESGKWELVRFGQVQFNAANRQGGTGGLAGGGTGLPNVPGVTGLLTGQNSQNQSPQNTFGQQSTNSAPGGIGTSGSSFGNSIPAAAPSAIRVTLAALSDNRLPGPAAISPSVEEPSSVSPARAKRIAGYGR